jgi:hypothetical protein
MSSEIEEDDPRLRCRIEVINPVYDYDPIAPITCCNCADVFF